MPDGAAEFDARQREFRSKLEAARKEKEQQERQSPVSVHSSTLDPPASQAQDLAAWPSEKNHVKSTLPLGSYSIASTGDARIAREAQQDGGKRKSAFSSLIYGTQEGREMDRDIERSFSQVLARGKYVHSIVFHEVKPSKVDEYVALIGSWYPKVAGMQKNKVKLVGSWRTEVGDCDTFGKCHSEYRVPG